MDSVTDPLIRQRLLDDAITAAIRVDRKYSHLIERSSFLLMFVALSCSACAAIAGFLFASAKIAGCFAIMPPLIAFIAVNLRLGSRLAWHRKRQALAEALRHRLRYQLPEHPSAEDVADVSRQYMAMRIRLQKEYKSSCEFTWNNLASHGRN